MTLDASGAKIGEMKYTPFGEMRSTSGSVPTDRRFTGQRQEDSGLGSLYDYGARFYSPLVGRFLSADTMVPQPENPQQFNRYSYVANNPIRYIDPSGHFLTETIKSYVQQHWGEYEWERVWQKWLADKNWWNLLRAAQGGDVLAMMDADNSLHYYQFEGNGETEWTGIMQVGDLLGSDLNGTRITILASDIQRRNLGFEDPVGVGLWRMKGGHLFHVGQFDPRGFSAGRTLNAEDIKFDSAFTSDVATLVSLLIPGPGWVKVISGLVVNHETSYYTSDLQAHYGIVEGNDTFVMGRYGMIGWPYTGIYSVGTRTLRIQGGR